jgi:hypothetical protein
MAAVGAVLGNTGIPVQQRVARHAHVVKPDLPIVHAVQAGLQPSTSPRLSRRAYTADQLVLNFKQLHTHTLLWQTLLAGASPSDLTAHGDAGPE